MESLTLEPEVRTPEAADRHLTRRRFLGLAGASLLGLGLYAGEIERHALSVVRLEIRIAHLPEAFWGFRLVQISDIHFAEFTEPGFVALAVKRVNQMRPDVVVMTGDFISMSPMRRDYAAGYIYPCTRLLDELTCPSRIAVLGNHDWVVNEALIAEVLGQHGIEVLQNRAVPLERGGQRLWISGIKDAMSGQADLDAAIPKHAYANREPVILLSHEPDMFDLVAPRSDVDLMLSGHTHGGQVRIPFFRPAFLPPLGKIYIEGQFRRGRTQLYVNRGLGAVGLPFRLNCPPEITEFTLVRA